MSTSLHTRKKDAKSFLYGMRYMIDVNMVLKSYIIKEISKIIEKTIPEIEYTALNRYGISQFKLLVHLFRP